MSDLDKIMDSYSEIFELLKFIDRKELDKIPIDLLKKIKNNRNKNYIPSIDINNLNSSLSKDAMAMYIWIYLNYMVDNLEEKNMIYKILYNNGLNNQKKIKLNEDMFNQRNNEFKSVVEDTDELKNEKYELAIVKNGKIKRIIEKIKIFLRGKK